MKNLFIHIKIFRLVLYEHVVLVERTFVQYPLNTLTGSEFPHCCLLFYSIFASTLKYNFFPLS